MLLGAVIAAYAPSLQMRVVSRDHAPGWRLELALLVLQRLQAARHGPQRGLSLAALAEGLRADPLQLEPVVDLLAAMDWVSRLDEGGSSRHVLLCDPARTPLAPLVERTLLQPADTTRAVALRLAPMSLAEALAAG